MSEVMETRMAYDLLVLFRAPAEPADGQGCVCLKQPGLGDDESIIALTLHQLPALIAELQRIYDTKKKAQELFPRP